MSKANHTEQRGMGDLSTQFSLKIEGEILHFASSYGRSTCTL